jgi:histidine kinase
VKIKLRFPRRLIWKIFATYLLIILVDIVILLVASEFVVPAAFDRHLAAMAAAMEHAAPELTQDLFANFRHAVSESLLYSTLAAFIAAVIASIFFSRQIVIPVRRMTSASHRIADGYFHERVNLEDSVGQERLDELGQLANSFNQMAAQLEQIESARLELIGNVAHELRTPLSGIQVMMEGLIDGVLPADDTTFQKVCREAGRLQRLVDDLQELSRIEAGAFSLETRPVPVSQLVDSVVDRLEYQFTDKGVQLELDVPPELPPVKVDEGRIEQVLLNLVGNALHYTKTGGRVTIRANQPDQGILISITDTGVGIPAEHLPLIFTRFYRVDKSRSRAGGGSGIGLTIARHLVESHGGRIWAESQGPGQGSTFCFTLPIAT